MNRNSSRKPTSVHSRRKRGRPWFWRWRRNPLRRRSDVVEAWIVFALWALALLGGVLSGWAVAQAVGQTFADRRADTRSVSAVLTENAADGSPVTAGYDVGRMWVTVRWAAADGTVHTGRAKAAPTATAGSHVQVWVNRGEQSVSPPPSKAESIFEAVASGALVGQLTVTAVYGGGWLVRRRLLRHRLAEWDDEWRRVGPQWRNFSGGKG
ncbi:Rv1733c family protein [Streptomyces sp. NPDC001123]